MKKVLLLIISLFFAQCVFAYQTVLVDFPRSEGWHAVYYNTQYNEVILQYVPAGQSAKKWTRAIIFHSYKNINSIQNLSNNAAKFMDTKTTEMENKNSSQLYDYKKYTDADSIATRCVTKNNYIPTQCEIYRVSNSHEGTITMHYINKDVADFKKNYDTWYNIMKNINIYYSYYRENRILDKATSFEL